MKKPFCLAVVMACICLNAGAQSNEVDFSNKKNIFKLNLTSPFLKNYAAQYERVLNKTVSIAISGRIMPETTMPFKDKIRKEFIKDDDPLITDAFNQAKFSNYAITPEIRFYLGRKGYGRGFYIAPYYRYAKYKVSQLDYTYDDGGDKIDIKLTGDLTANTGGLLLGAQWMFGKVVGLDWWIAGPSIGKGKGSMSGLSNKPIDADMQQDIRASLENDLDIPFTKKTVTVDANGANVKMDGPWAGIRAGLMLTFRF